MLAETARPVGESGALAFPAASEIPRTAEKSARGRVLVVDDEALIRWSIAETLEPLGYEVVQAASGGEAVRLLLERSPFQVVLLDMQLPDCTDLRLLGLMRSVAPVTPIVLMGAFLSPEVEAEADWLGAARLLRKPFDLEALPALVDILGRDERSDDSGR
jgi:DNA-binding NtrC family response regulator